MPCRVRRLYLATADDGGDAYIAMSARASVSKSARRFSPSVGDGRRTKVSGGMRAVARTLRKISPRLVIAPLLFGVYVDERAGGGNDGDDGSSGGGGGGDGGGDGDGGSNSEGARARLLSGSMPSARAPKFSLPTPRPRARACAREKLRERRKATASSARARARERGARLIRRCADGQRAASTSADLS